MTTVVIPAYNAEETLAECLAALSQQTHVPDAVIVVDDGSTDRTAEIARRFGVQLIQQENQGPAAARNVGAHDAHGNLLLFTDADCEPAKDWVAEMVAPFADPEVSGVKGVYRTRQRERIARLAQCEFEERYERLSRFTFIDFVDTYSAAFRMTAFHASGGFPPGFPEANNEDVELSYRLARAGCRFVFNPRAVVHHHHQASWASYFRLKVKRGHWRMIVYRLHPGKALTDSYTPQMLKVQVLLLLLAVGAIVVGCFWPVGLWAAGLCLLALLASAGPFARLVWHRDRWLTPWALPFVVVRTTAFVIGVTTGIVAAARFQTPPKPRRA